MDAILSHILAFVGMIVVDFAYAEYTKACSKSELYKSCNMAATIIGFQMAVNTIGVTDWIYLPSIIAGAWVGTFLSLRRK
jgi:hypothetical protein